MNRPIAVCGGGSLAHALAAVLGAGDRCVRVLTRNPSSWRRRIRVTYQDCILIGNLERVSNDPADVLPGCGLVFVEVPAFAHADVLGRIQPFIDSDTWIGALPGAGGFDLRAAAALPGHERVFGSARTPYICRTMIYGESVAVTGIDAVLRVASLLPSETPVIAAMIEEALGMRTLPLSSYDAVNLTPSNPLVHTARIFTFLEGTADGDGAFYRDWDDDASRMLLACDDEIAAVRRLLGIAESEVPPVRAHYAVTDANELTRRIRGLRPLLDSDIPIRAAASPDHRYFAEDFDYGLAAMAGIANRCGVRIPTIETMLAWRAQRR